MAWFIKRKPLSGDNPMIHILLTALLAAWIAAGVGVAVLISRLARFRHRIPQACKAVPAELLASRDRQRSSAARAV